MTAVAKQAKAASRELGIGDIGAVKIIKFDAEAVTSVAGIVDDVKVVQRAIGTCSLLITPPKSNQASGLGWVLPRALSRAL
jgi:hypothetical protein